MFGKKDKSFETLEQSCIELSSKIRRLQQDNDFYKHEKIRADGLEAKYEILSKLVKQYFDSLNHVVAEPGCYSFGMRSGYKPTAEQLLQRGIDNQKKIRDDAEFEHRVLNILKSTIQYEMEKYYDDKKSISAAQTSRGVCGSGTESQQTDAVRTGRDSEGPEPNQQGKAPGGSQRFDGDAGITGIGWAIADSDRKRADVSRRIEETENPEVS